MRNMSDPFIFFTNLLNITQSEKIDILQNIPRQKLHIFPGNHLFQTHFYDFEYLENNTARPKSINAPTAKISFIYVPLSLLLLMISITTPTRAINPKTASIAESAELIILITAVS